MTRSPPDEVFELLSRLVLLLLTWSSHGLRGFETWFGGHPIQGFREVGDVIALLTALAVGMLVAAAAVRPRA